MLVALITFLAVFVQSSIGFGLALVAMPLAVELLGLQIAAPLVALIATTAEFFVLLYYRHAINLRVVARITIAAIVGIPLGVYILSRADPAVVTTALGILLVGYGLYALSNLKLPELASRGWAYLFGFTAGILAGAYNTSGPPVVVYGNCRRWTPDVFKSNLQGFFVVNGLVVILTHALTGNYTTAVWQEFLWSLPGMAVGLLAGFVLSKRINPDLFRKIVLVMLIILGLRLIFG